MKCIGFILLLCVIQITLTQAFCSTDKDCEHDGKCRNNKCECAVNRYAGSNCQEFVEDYLGTKYLVFFYFTTVASIILWILSSLKTYQMHRDGKKFTMLHLACWFVAVAMFLRSISYLLVVDGQWGRDDGLEPFSGLCFFLFYPLILGSFLLMVFIWYAQLRNDTYGFRLEMYTATTAMQVERLPRYRKLFIAINGFLFPVEFVTRTVTAIYKDTNVAYSMYTIYYAFMGVVSLLEIGGFIIIAALILNRLSKSKAVTGSETTRKAFMKISSLLLLISLIMLVTLGVTVAFLTRYTPEVWLTLAWIARVTEYSGACILIYVYNVPGRSKEPSFHTDVDMTSRNSPSVH